MSKPVKTRLVLETGVSTLGNGADDSAGVAATYAIVGRTTHDTFTNKTITDPSNVIAATQLSVGGTPLSIAPGGSAGDVLTLTPSGCAFLPAADGLAVVRVPITAITLSGGAYYASFGAPVNIYGSAASSITVRAATLTPVGSEFVCSSDIYSAALSVGLQYVTQAAARRTFINIVSGGTPMSSFANSVPQGINNFRQGLFNIQYGRIAGTVIAALVNTDASAPLTLNGGYIDVSIFT